MNKTNPEQLRADDPVGHEAPQADIDQLESAVGPESSLWSDAWHTLKHNPMFIVSGIIIVILILIAAFPQLVLSWYPGETDPDACSLVDHSANVPTKGRPSGDAWFGHDIQGCDYFTRTILGTRTSIAVGWLVTVGAFVIALVFGSIAGYFGGVIDSIIARITDVWFALPGILFAIVALSVVDGLPEWIPIMDEQRGIPEVAIVLIATGWTGMLRLMRSSVLSNREADYVSASKALGASHFRIITRHIIPNSMAPVIVYATIFVGVIISAEAALSFLGVGLQLPAISWGLMISVASRQILNAPHLLLFPGIFLSVTVLSFIMMGDALRDALDPKLR